MWHLVGRTHQSALQRYHLIFKDLKQKCFMSQESKFSYCAVCTFYSTHLLKRSLNCAPIKLLAHRQGKVLILSRWLDQFVNFCSISCLVWSLLAGCKHARMKAWWSQLYLLRFVTARDFDGGGSFKYRWSLSTSTIRINHPVFALFRTHQKTVCKIRMFAFCVDPGLNITLCLDQTHGGEHDSCWEIFLTVYGLGMWWFVPHITLNTKRPWGWSASHFVSLSEKRKKTLCTWGMFCVVPYLLISGEQQDICFCWSP